MKIPIVISIIIFIIFLLDYGCTAHVQDPRPVCCASMKEMCTTACGKITCQAICKVDASCGGLGTVTCGPYNCKDIAAGSCTLPWKMEILGFEYLLLC